MSGLFSDYLEDADPFSFSNSSEFQDFTPFHGRGYRLDGEQEPAPPADKRRRLSRKSSGSKYSAAISSSTDPMPAPEPETINLDERDSDVEILGTSYRSTEPHEDYNYLVDVKDMTAM